MTSKSNRLWETNINMADFAVIYETPDLIPTMICYRGDNRDHSYPESEEHTKGGQRIKARKAIKRSKEFKKSLGPDDVESASPPAQKDSTSPQPSDKPRERTKEDAIKRTGVISSLFTFNPEIPSLPASKVKPVKETLFSSDSFKDVPLHPYMVSNLEKLGFTKMTAVQQETLPRLMDGNDVLVKSQTGSGKTMAYAIPIVEDLCHRSPKLTRQDGVQALVIVPTRELALQSFEVFQKLLKPFTWLVPSCLFGGEKRKSEKARLRKGINILIATPGRLIDHIENTKSLSLAKMKWLILDEADRLLDMGFEAKVSHIVSCIDQQAPFRQTVLLSATLTDGVERLAGISLRDPQRVNVQSSSSTSSTKMSGSLLKKHTTIESSSSSSLTSSSLSPSSQPESEQFALPEGLKQKFVITPCKLRLVTLLTLILTKCKRGNKVKMLVFVSTQDSVEFHYRLVRYLLAEHSSSEPEDEEEVRTSLNLYRLHGDMSQKERTSTFQDFCETSSGVLFCTDVASRGLHLPSVQWVVQYSCPGGVADYVHRVGRTARAGGSGTSVLFVLPSEADFVTHLNQQSIRVEELKMGEILKENKKILPIIPQPDPTRGHLPSSVEETATYLQTCCESHVKTNKEMLNLAKKGYQSYIRAYATYPSNLKTIFHVKHLHLGHVAKTFGLRDAPSNMGGVQGVSTKQMQGKRKREEEYKKSHSKKPRQEVSEFSGAPVFTSIITKKMARKMQKTQRKNKR